MSEIRQNLLYTKDHEWVLQTTEPNIVRVGISDFAQSALGDITFVELPEVGAELEIGSSFGTVESVKSVSDLYAPLSGTVLKINESLNDDPSQLNSSPYDDAWIVELKITKPQEIESLLKAGAYESIAQ